MSCRETPAIIAASVEASLTPEQRQQWDAHVRACAHCRDALADVGAVNRQLLTWRDVPVPDWQRIPASLRHAPEKHRERPRFSFWGQWAPLAASCVLALAVVFNVQLSVDDNGMALRFGASQGVSEDQLATSLAAFEQVQQQQFEALSAAFEERQAETNARLIDTMVEQFGASTSRSMEQVLAYFETQRQQDLEQLRASYQQLADSDFQTIRSVQQLASYVQYQGGQR